MKYCVIFAISLMFLSCSAPHVLITNEEGKYKIEQGMSVAITLPGQSYPFDESCTSTCKNCDSTLLQARWWVDTIRESEFVLRYDHEFEMDTITNKEFKARSKAERKLHIFKVLSIEKRPYYVYKIPTQVERQTIRYEDLDFITYSDKPECYKGSPIKGIFHNPNRIHKVKMLGATFEVDLKL